MDKKYKVGEFMKNLGVSVGFLKHHERYGTLKPHISPSGYRYYEFNQAMQAMQCIRLKNLGLTSKEIADMLTHSSELDPSKVFREKKEELRKKLIFEQEILNYLDFYDQIFEGDQTSDPTSETWSIYTPEPFYYLQNASERQFIEDSQLQEIAAKWVDYAPVTDVVSCVSLDLSERISSPLRIQSWNMGLTIRKSVAEKLSVPSISQTQLISPGKCLVYSYTGNRPVKKGHDHLQAMLKRPMAICRKHHFQVCGDIFEFNFFCSTSESTSYVREVIYIPIKD